MQLMCTEKSQLNICRLDQIGPKFPNLEMDKVSTYEENHPEAQAQMNRSNTETGHSALSGDTYGYSRTNSETSSFSELNDENSSIDEASPLGWPVAKSMKHSQAILTRLGMKQHNDVPEAKCDEKTLNSDLETMKERFSKLLLGEDMSGSGKGVCTAVAISNAITNLFASVFGQFWRLEPLAPEKKSMWKREMDCLLSVCDYIVEFIPSSQNFPEGTTLEVMTSRRRSDISINLPALQKLDTMLLDILGSFSNTEIWYVEDGNLSSNKSSSGSFRRIIQRKEEKWWLPVPCVPPLGLSEKSRKQLQHKRECANQILKAAMVINSSILDEIEVPETYLATLPKSGRASLGDSVHRYMSTADKFSPDYLLDCLNITTEHEALEVADRIEASMYVWRRKACLYNSQSSWDTVKDLMADGDKNVRLANRADSLLSCLKQRHPGLSQTTLDTSKIQYSKDVGQSILESYSRVLESLAFNIAALIDDVLYVDGSVKHRNKCCNELGPLNQIRCRYNFMQVKATLVEASKYSRVMIMEPQDKPRPQVVKLDKALKLAEAWVNNMSASAADEMVERKFEGRPPRLGLGAKLPPSKAAASADPVEKKLRAKLDAGKKRAAKDLEELNASDRNGEHSGDDEDGLESRANAFVKKRPMVPATTLQVKKKGK
ncbi:hypothetical protein MRB53_004639 [Persea americana]|uniref:Uncharacterized protein n=1 Tax=Persea americana TaxID=3435 RepID=A0ACC2MBY7_PERAE|nr:hypothetical protein MRB53_004639 [Persea americana]